MLDDSFREIIDVCQNDSDSPFDFAAGRFDFVV